MVKLFQDLSHTLEDELENSKREIHHLLLCPISKLNIRIASTMSVMTTKRRSRSTAKATADVITVTTGMAISSNNPDAITACGRSMSKPDHTCSNVWGSAPKSIVCAVSPPGCSNWSSTPTRIIVVLKITPRRNIQPMIVEVCSFGCTGFFGLVTVDSIAGCDSALNGVVSRSLEYCLPILQNLVLRTLKSCVLSVDTQ